MYADEKEVLIVAKEVGAIEANTWCLTPPILQVRVVSIKEYIYQKKLMPRCEDYSLVADFQQARLCLLITNLAAARCLLTRSHVIH